MFLVHVLVLPAALTVSLAAQSWTIDQATPKKEADATGRANSLFSRNEEDLPKGTAPQLNGHPDLSGYWVPSRKDKPVGNLGKDLPGYKLPFTPVGEAAHKYNVEHTVDPEALCIVGGLPRHDASGLPFQLLRGAIIWSLSTSTGIRRIDWFRSTGANIPTIPIHRFSAMRSAHGMEMRS